MLGSRIIPIDSSEVIESTDAISTSGWGQTRFIRFAGKRSTDYAMAPCLVFVSCTVVIIEFIETRGSYDRPIQANYCACNACCTPSPSINLEFWLELSQFQVNSCT